MDGKRKTELDIDLDLEVKDVVEEKAEEKQKPPEEKKKGKLRFKLPAFPPKFLILFIAVTLVFIVLISGIFYYWPEKKSPETKEQTVKEPVSFAKVPQYQFAPFFLPVKINNDEEIFLKTAFSVDLSNEVVVREIEQNIALLRANLSVLFKKKNLNDLKFDTGRIKLGREIINIMNRSLQKGTAKNVYFTQFLLN